MKFQLLVFDWDGTLMDSEARIVDSMRAALQDSGLWPRTREQIRNIIGLGLREAVRALIPEAPEAAQQRVVERYRHHYLGAEAIPSPLFSGAAEVVTRLAEHDYLLAVATGKGRRGLDKALQDTGLAPVFHVTRCADEAQSKPHPEMLEQIMEASGVTPAQTLMIGDTEYDVLLALNAGASALAVSYGVHDRERLMRLGPIGCLTDIRELPDWLAGHRERSLLAG